MKKMVENHKPTVEEMGRHTTPHSKHPERAHKSLSHPKDADEVGSKGTKDGMSSSRFGHREGFTPNTGDVADPYDCKREEIADVEPGSLRGD